jgi:TonB family protein
MRKARILRWSRLRTIGALALLLPMWPPTAAARTDPVDREAAGWTGASYHVRLLRARWDEGTAGSALFKPDEIVVPLAEREPWGRPEQVESLRRSLGATAIEAIPGLVVRAGPAGDGEPHWFRTALGEELLEISFAAEALPEGWHRVRVGAWGERGAELVDASLLVQDDRTVALVAPFGDAGEALIVGVTPMGRATAFAEGIRRSGFGEVTYPRVREETMVRPTYPEAARELGLTGQVILEAVVRADGSLDGIVVLRMPEGGEWLAGAAVEAISQWRYEPGTIGGVPVDVYFTIVVEFLLK